MKMGRPQKGIKRHYNPTEELADLLARQTMIKVVQEWLPRQALERLDVEQLIAFREESRTIRQQFFSETRDRVDKKIAGAGAKQVERIISATSEDIIKQATKYQAEIEGLTDKLWPNLLGALASKPALMGIGLSLGASLIPGIGLALGASIILSPAQMLLASIPALVQPAKVLLKWKGDRKKILRKGSATVAYLSSAAKLKA